MFKDLKRLQIVEKLREGGLNQKVAIDILGCATRAIKRLCANHPCSGPLCLAS